MGFTEVLRLIQSAQNYTTLLSAPYCRMDKLSHLHHSHYFLAFSYYPISSFCLQEPLYSCWLLCNQLQGSNGQYISTMSYSAVLQHA